MLLHTEQLLASDHIVEGLVMGYLPSAAGAASGHADEDLLSWTLAALATQGANVGGPTHPTAAASSSALLLSSNSCC